MEIGCAGTAIQRGAIIIHDAIDHLPDDQMDPTYRVLLAIADEEPISPELENRILEAAAIERGEGITIQELNRELGL